MQQPRHTQKTAFGGTHPPFSGSYVLPSLSAVIFPEPWRGDIDALFATKNDQTCLSRQVFSVPPIPSTQTARSLLTHLLTELRPRDLSVEGPTHLGAPGTSQDGSEGL